MTPSSYYHSPIAGSSSTTAAGGGPSYVSPMGQQTVQSERVLSSNILGETLMGPMPAEDNVQYVEVPVVEEVIRHVPKKEIVEIEKRVPRYEYEWVDRVIEIPQIHYVDKHVEVPQIQEVIRRVPVKQYVDVPKEIVRHVPKVEIKVVEREVEVPGEIIEVPKPYFVENRVIVPRYTDKEVPTVVSQKLVPVISESETDFVDVELREYNPYLVPVDVYVPRPVSRQLIATSKSEEHRVVDVPVGQFNMLLRQMNGHVSESDVHDILIRDQRGAIPMMPLTAGSMVVPPVSAEWENYHTKGMLHYDINAPSFHHQSTGIPIATTMTTTTPTTATSTYGQKVSTVKSTTTTMSGPVLSSSYTTGVVNRSTGMATSAIGASGQFALNSGAIGAGTSALKSTHFGGAVGMTELGHMYLQQPGGVRDLKMLSQAQQQQMQQQLQQARSQQPEYSTLESGISYRPQLAQA